MASFLNCFAYRLHRKKSIRGRSFCDHCKHPLSAKDLVPLFSYLFMRGKCRYCKEKVSVEHFFFELGTGVLFLLFYTSEITLLPYFLFTAALLSFVFIYDLRHFVIPDVANYLLIFSAFAYVLYMGRLDAILAAGGALLFFLLLYKGKWIDFSEVKFFVFMGLFLGFPHILVGLFLSFLIGAIMGVVIVKGIKGAVPFAPFLVAGTVIAHLFGEKIISLYFSMI